MSSSPSPSRWIRQRVLVNLTEDRIMYHLVREGAGEKEKGKK